MEVLSKNRKFSIVSLTIVLSFFFVLSFIRWETGTDWNSYLEVFERIKIPWNSLEDKYSEFEIGFMVLYNLARSVSDSYTVMLLVEAVLLYMCVYNALKSQSIFPIFSLLMYYSMSLAGIFFVRQNIAMAILLCSLPYIIDRKPFKFCIIVFMAFLIHRTALIFLIAYPCFFKYYELKTIIIFLFCAIGVGLFLGKLFLGMMSGLELGIVSLKINAYLNMGVEDNSTTFSTTAVLLRGILNRVFLIIIYMSLLNRKRKTNYVLNGLINLNLLGIILYVILTPIAFSLGRITAYFDIMQILILPYLLNICTLRTRCGLMVFLLLYMVFRLYTILAAYPDEYIPYKTFFNL